MGDSYGYVSLSDDDCAVEVPSSSSNYCKKVDTEAVETIVIDEELSQRSSDSKIDTELRVRKLKTKNKFIPGLNSSCEMDKLFTEFIEKCIDLENSDGMIRIVNRTLIKVYELSDRKYRKSPEYQRVLLKALNRLETDPQHKFSHVKDMVETLKLHPKKKRANLTTLTTNLEENRNGNIRKKPKIDIVISDDEHKGIPTITLDDDQNDVIVLDEEKENQSVLSRHDNDNLLVPQTEVSWDPVINIVDNEVYVSDQNVLPIYYEPSSTALNMERIKKIEQQIACCKEKIAFYEEAEVDDDSTKSPYLMSGRYKAKVVLLYKELCQLIGKQPIKKRKVRLQVLEGHPPGPVRKLESFINNNIGEDGVPHFPDFCDVVKCVMASNIEDSLQWNKHQIMKEASSLFTQCGRALQKRRQRREYRDLLSKVKSEQPDYDPADEDPELQRRLEENKRIAVKNENDLLERYCIMENLPATTRFNHANIESEDSELEPVEVNELTCINSEDCISELTGDSIQSISVDDDQGGIINDDEDSNFEPPEVEITPQNKDHNDNNEGNNQTIATEVKIKEEPIDIVKMLEELGDNYTVSIVSFEDPFLVIDISSDSSDDDDETK